MFTMSVKKSLNYTVNTKGVLKCSHGKNQYAIKEKIKVKFKWSSLARHYVVYLAMEERLLDKFLKKKLRSNSLITASETRQGNDLYF